MPICHAKFEKTRAALDLHHAEKNLFSDRRQWMIGFIFCFKEFLRERRILYCDGGA
jgi:hypothetical protein